MKPNYKKYILPTLLIVILGFGVYANSLDGEFIWDDNQLVRDNTHIKSWANATKLFTESIVTEYDLGSSFYRPIQMLTYIFDYSLWNLNVRGYHLTNIVLHILVALAIFWFINILYDDNILSTIAAVFFVVHPIHTMVINYISTRAESLYLLFLLLTFIFYIKFLRSKNIIPYILMLLSYPLALLSKETSLILPALLLLYHYTFKEKIKPKEFLSILGTICAYALLRMMLTENVEIGRLCNTTVFQRLPGFFVAITNYIRLLFLPSNLHIEYGNNLFKITDPQAILGLFILASLLFWAYKAAKANNKLVFFSISWFFIALLPVSNIFPINAYMSENWLYLPSIGFFVIVANGLCQVLRDTKQKHLAHEQKHLAHKLAPEKFVPGARRYLSSAPGTIVILTILIAFYSFLTIKQNNYWREPVSFYERTLRYTPQSARIHNNLGKLYNDIGKYEEAIDLLKKSLELKPNYAEAYNNLGVSYIYTGKYEEAIPLFKKSLELRPNYTKPYNNLGAAYSSINRNEEAIASFEKAVEVNPYNAGAYYNLCIVHFREGHYDLAIEYYDKAIELGCKPDPEFPKLLEPYRNRNEH